MYQSGFPYLLSVCNYENYVHTRSHSPDYDQKKKQISKVYYLLAIGEFIMLSQDVV